MPKRFKHLILFFALIIVPLLLGAYSPKTILASRQIVSAISQPFFEFTHETASWVIHQRDLFVSIFNLQEKNRQLAEELEDLKRRVSSFEEINQENTRLKQLLGFQKEASWKTISAQVIARDLSHWTHYVTINKGSKDGVQVEMPVVTGNGLVGKTVQVTDHSARVILLIDSESRVSAFLQDTRDVGLIEGTASPLLRMTYLDLQAGLRVGQTVVSSGFGGVYPKGIPIGEVVQIGEDKTKLSLYAITKPYVQFSKLEEVLCLKNVKPENPKSV